MTSSPDPATEFLRLIDIMATLRGPDGCPWDREQTIDTLKRFVLEESYELVDAIDRHDHAALREELGDYLFEAVFIAQLEQEAGHFAIADSLNAVADKLVRRHPHVFKRNEGEAALDTANQVRARWEDIKQQERKDQAKPTSVLSGIPVALPALVRATQIGARAASVGFDWTRAEDVVDKLREEVDEIAEVVTADGTAPDPARLEDEVGDLLFAITNLARKLGVDAEAALRKATNKFSRRFMTLESAIEASGQTMRDLPLAELEERWQQAKSLEG